jgi:pimeloyl-ACP methyl ester carboxylesterase
MAAAYTRKPYLIIHRQEQIRKDIYGAIDDAIPLQAQLMRGDQSRDTVLIAMHPVGAPAYLPMFPELARHGHHVIACATRYWNGDAALQMENCLLDVRACVRDARVRLGYKNVVLVGWSGGGALMAGFQAEAQAPVVSHTAAGERTALAGAEMSAGDALVLVASHRSRHHLLTGQLDPSVVNEMDPERRDAALDLYDPHNSAQPPYAAEYLARFRAAQLHRNRRITGWVKDKLTALRAAGREHEEYGFVVHRTMADPRWLDPTIEPNGRPANWTYLGEPRIVNNSPAALARYTSLRSWLSQWSIDDAQFDSVDAAPRITVPSLVITAGADDACPPSHAEQTFNALAAADKERLKIADANHYFSGPAGKSHLAQAGEAITRWLDSRGFGN